MFTTYKVIPGDTFETIARRKYGTELDAPKIAQANPGVYEPLVPGTTLIVPEATDLLTYGPAADQDETAVLINGVRFRFWNTLRIVRAIDAVDIVELGAPFESDAPGFRETFRPFSYAPLTVTIGGSPLFTGTMVAVTPSLTPTSKTISVGGYGRPGVLNDCTAPASAYPLLEWDNAKLDQIAAAVAKPFGIDVEFTAPAGAAFERVALEPGRRVMDFLADLAKQRGLVIGSTETGALLFQKERESGVPVAMLVQGQTAPAVSVSASFSPQEYYSHVTGVEPVIVGLAGSQYTVRNPRLAGALRPMTFALTDADEAGVQPAVEAKAARMFGNMASYSVRVSTWRDAAGVLWKPNTFVSLTAPGAMIYSSYTFTVRSVEFEATSDGGRAATLDLVIPGSFRGKLPEVLPWEG